MSTDTPADMRMYTIFAKSSIALMKGNRGKLVTQGQHAVLHAYWVAEDRFPGSCTEYRDNRHARKINCVVETVDELKVIENAYRDVCGVSLVTDAGFTVFEEPTTTCLGVGPIRDDQIGDDLKALKLLL